MSEHRFSNPGAHSYHEWFAWHQGGECGDHRASCCAGQCPFHEDPARAVVDLRGAEPKLPPMRGPRDPENLGLFERARQ
jgi:hypothetical protein